MDPMDNEELALEPFWSPLLSVDVSDPSGVWIRFGKADLARCDKMMVNIYKESKTDSSKVIFVKTLEVKCPDDAVKWENLLAGRYLLTAYVPIRGCKFMCEPDERRCEQCLRTHLNVYIEDDKASLYWIALQTFNDSSSEILIAAIIVAVIVIVSMLIWLCMYLYKNYKEAQQTRSIPLKNFVKTMVVYADDHASHLKVIRLFVECLRNCATCDPIYDVEKLLTLERELLQPAKPKTFSVLNPILSIFSRRSIPLAHRSNRHCSQIRHCAFGLCSQDPRHRRFNHPPPRPKPPICRSFRPGDGVDHPRRHSQLCRRPPKVCYRPSALLARSAREPRPPRLSDVQLAPTVLQPCRLPPRRSPLQEHRNQPDAPSTTHHRVDPCLRTGSAICGNDAELDRNEVETEGRACAELPVAGSNR